MDWLTFFSTIFKAAVWPAVVVYLLYMVRGKLNDLLESLANRLESAEGLGLKLGFAKIAGAAAGLEVFQAGKASDATVRAEPDKTASPPVEMVNPEPIDDAEASTPGTPPEPLDKARSVVRARTKDEAPKLPGSPTSTIVMDFGNDPVVKEVLYRLGHMSDDENAGDLIFTVGEWLRSAIFTALQDVGQPYSLAAKAEGMRLNLINALHESQLLDYSSVKLISNLLAQENRLQNSASTKIVTKDDAFNYFEVSARMVSRLKGAVSTRLRVNQS